MQGIGIVLIDGPPLEEFWDVSQGGLAKISWMSRKGVSERISYLHLTSNSEYQNVLATERHQKICLAFSISNVSSNAGSRVATLNRN